MNAEPGSVFTLFIETGLHAGTVQRLAPGNYTVGSELEADIILSDKDIEAVHLIVELDRQGLRLEPLQGAIAVDGEHVSLEPGGERHLAFPVRFSIGGTSIKITAPKDAVESRRRMRRALVATGVAFLTVVGFQLVDPLGGAPGQKTASALPQEPQIGQAVGDEGTVGMKADSDGKEGRSPNDENTAVTLPTVTLDQAAAALRERLAANDFRDVEVKTAVDRIIVRGEAEPVRMGEWQDIRIWFDGAFGRDFLLVAKVEPAEKETPPSLAIEAVWSGDDPYLIAGGQRFAVGAHVGDGWMIDRIGTDEIMFKRGDRSFSLTL